jgi:hypothetical protein
MQLKNKRFRSIIISPAGNLYGSERVLLDFLLHTRNSYTVFIPNKGIFKDNLTGVKHQIKYYSNSRLIRFYLRILVLGLIRPVKTIYVNEGGHIKYIKVLSIILPWVKFIVHIRLIEDTNHARIGSVPKNVALIAISDYIRQALPGNSRANIYSVHDPYPFQETSSIVKPKGSDLCISIIGRFTLSKGALLAAEYFNYIDQLINYKIQLHIFGTIEKNNRIDEILKSLSGLKNIRIIQHGFVVNTSEIYGITDLVMHFNKQEPLGRIFLEAIDHFVPFIGFNMGGIGEIASVTGLEDFVVDSNSYWKEKMLRIMNNINVDILSIRNRILKSKMIAKTEFSLSEYTNFVEKLFQ